MPEQLSALTEKAGSNTLLFKETLDFIDALYQHTPTAFRNGEVFNEAGQNQGSAKVFAFAKMNQLSQPATLLLFAEHYRSVLDDPQGTSHQNIRQFMIHGWDGIAFDGEVLVKR